MLSTLSGLNAVRWWPHLLHLKSFAFSYLDKVETIRDGRYSCKDEVSHIKTEIVHSGKLFIELKFVYFQYEDDLMD